MGLVLVVGVGTTLFRNGGVFLRDVFTGQEELARAVNRLLLVGFYLINVGLVLLTSTVGSVDDGPDEQFRTLTVKLGLLALLLGLVHLLNLLALNSARRRRLQEGRRAPRRPAAYPQPGSFTG